MNNCSDYDIFVICASNEPQMVDKAIKRTGRMDKRIYVGPPDSKGRTEILKMHLKDRYSNPSIDFEQISKKTENYIASDMKAIVDQAARLALKEGIKISTNHLLTAVECIPPSLSSEEIQQYKDKM